MMEQIRDAAGSFSGNPAVAGRLIRELSSEDPDEFYRAAVALLKQSEDLSGYRYLIALLIQRARLLEELCDPARFSKDESIALARKILQIEPMFDIRLARLLPGPQSEAGSQLTNATAERILDVLDRISQGTRLVPVLAHLVRHSYPRLRSKAILLIGRRVQNARSAEKLLQEMDPRVRANAIESLWGVDSDGARALLWQTTKDENNRVAGNALYGLYYLEDHSVIPTLIEMAADPKPERRATAAWAMGAASDPRFLTTLARMVVDSGPLVRTNAFKAISQIRKATARSVEGGTLEIRLIRVGVLADGSRSVWTIVRTADGEAVPRLSAIRFILSEGASLVTDYQIVECSCPDTLAVGFALCGEAGLPGAALEAAQQAVLACLELKRQNDPWSIVRLSCSPQTTGQEAIEDARYLPNRDSLKKLAMDDPTPCRMSPAMLEAIRLLIPGAASVRGGRSLVLLTGSQFAEHKDLETVGKACLAANVTINAVGYGGAQPGIDLFCRTTGGIFVPAPEVRQIGEAYRTIYRGLVHRYEIHYQPPASGEEPAKLQIYAPSGHGECSWRWTGALAEKP